MVRAEILAGPERRRFWSDEQKRAILEEAATGGMPMAAVARRHDILPQQIYAWRRQLGVAAPGSTAPTFLPVALVAAEEGVAERRECAAASEKPSGAIRAGRIQVRCTNGRILNVEADLDAAMLRTLIRSVEDA